jgi:hypothetical protein
MMILFAIVPFAAICTIVWWLEHHTRKARDRQLAFLRKNPMREPSRHEL